MPTTTTFSVPRSEEFLKQKILELESEIKRVKKSKKFGMLWENTPEKTILECKVKLPALKEVSERLVQEDKNKDLTHVLIEGDNYHSLSVLNYTHQKAIDLIYIDPPYNTGDKNWKYNNSYVDKSDRFRHSKWLSMMEKRLRLAKQLLKDDGVLICAIDKNEQAHLGVMLEDIFTDHELHCLTIVHNPRGVQGDNFAYTNEFAYFVFRDKQKIIERLQREEGEAESATLRNWGGESLRTDAKNCFYPVLVQGEKIIGFGDVPEDDFHPITRNVLRKDGIIEVYPIDNSGVERKWRYARQSVEEIINLLGTKKMKTGDLDIELVKTEDRPKTVWVGTRYDANEYGTKIVKRITGKDFPFPKSLYTVKDCLERVVKGKKEAIVLDFFAGSGTTGHAVLEMNREDGGNRQCILCTNNENNICEEITYERVKRVIKGYKYQGKEKKVILERKISFTTFKQSQKIIEEIEKIRSSYEAENWETTVEVKNDTLIVYAEREVNGFTDGLPANLRYFKTDFIDYTDVSDDLRTRMVERCSEILCLKENTFEETLQEKAFSIFHNSQQYTAILFDTFHLRDFKKKLQKLDKKIVIYVFSLDRHFPRAEFEGLGIDFDIEPIPEPILEVYKRIFDL